MDEKEKEREERLNKLTEGFRRRQALEKEIERGQQQEGCGWTIMMISVIGLLFQLGILILAGICQLMK